MAEITSHQWVSAEQSFLGMPCVQSIRSLWSWLTSVKRVAPFGPANHILFCSQIVLAQGRPQTRDRRIHSGVRHPLLAEIVGVTRPDDRTLGELDLRPTRTVNGENGSDSAFRAVGLLLFLFRVDLYTLSE